MTNFDSIRYDGMSMDQIMGMFDACPLVLILGLKEDGYGGYSLICSGDTGREGIKVFSRVLSKVIRGWEEENE